MKDNASIFNNKLTQTIEEGGGVLVWGEKINGIEYPGYFIMEGGTVSGNSADGPGGGVYVDSYGNFIMSGGIVYGSDASESLRNNASFGIALSIDSNASAKYGDGTDILPHTDNQTYRTDHTITGRQ